MSSSWQLDIVGVVSMFYTLVTFLSSYFVAWSLIGVRCNLPRTDRHTVAWLIWDTIVHITIEGPFVIISLLGTVKDSSSFFALMWKEYGKADTRWLVSDSTIVSLEIATVFICSPLCIALIYAICKQTYYRHFLQITLCVMELYGGWMTFVPDILDGSPNLETGNVIFLYVYLIFYNGIWVIVPAILLYQSLIHFKSSSSESARHQTSIDSRQKINSPRGNKGQKKKA